MIAGSPLFLAGPPFDATIWRGVLARLGVGRSIGVLDASAPTHGWRERAASLAAVVGPETVLVAHGLAVPTAIEVARTTRLAGLVLSNGPVRVGRLGSVARLSRGLVGAALSPLLRPPLSTSLLASSAGLRRLVVNPYVMDRDTVALLSEPVLGSAALRRASRAYLTSLDVVPDPAGVRCPTLILWGESDPIFPASEAAYLEATVPRSTYVRIPGGHHFHIEERPWAFADTLAAWRPDPGSAA